MPSAVKTTLTPRIPVTSLNTVTVISAKLTLELLITLKSRTRRYKVDYLALELLVDLSLFHLRKVNLSAVGKCS